MDTQEYLIARVGDLHIGLFCQDVQNVYRRRMHLVKLFYQDFIYRGITQINGKIMQVIDLRRRIGFEERTQKGELTLISFQTSISQVFAVVVDEIIGMKSINSREMQKHDSSFGGSHNNINLLFPVVAVLKDGMLVHLMDSTYLDKLQPIIEDSGELEMF